MESRGRILYWFREPVFHTDLACLCQALSGCRELIPVFCFDSRESHHGLSENSFQTQLSDVARLREELKQKGSNLLVVYNHYEVIIPSLARVLNVDRVVTHPLSGSKSGEPVTLRHFREEKFNEVQYLLKMHSIGIEVTGPAKPVPVSILPNFPSINPGVLKPLPGTSF